MLARRDGRYSRRLAAVPCRACDAGPHEHCWRLDGTPRRVTGGYSGSHQPRWIDALHGPDPAAVVVISGPDPSCPNGCPAPCPAPYDTPALCLRAERLNAGVGPDGPSDTPERV